MASVRLRHLTVSNLRTLSACRLELDSDLIIFAGENGSGKTSVLEAVYLLSTGRSFRSRSVADVIQRGADQVQVHGELSDVDGQSVRMGVEKRRSGSFRLRMDGERVTRMADLARRLPLVLITPDNQRLLTDGSEGRRRLVDWLLFHVEPRYGELHARYRQALKQRNGMLRNAGRHAGVSEAWDEELAVAGEQLAEARSRHSARMVAELMAIARELSCVPVEITFSPGWPLRQGALADALHRNWERDLSRGYTSEGPHRADLLFTMQGRPARDVLSRGESKLLTAAIQLALARLLADITGVLPVLLVDELASELDERNRRGFFDALRETGCQTLVTTVDAQLVPEHGWRFTRRIRMHGGEASTMLQ